MISLKELKNKARQLQPAVRIGKSGLTSSLINEIILQLKKKKLIKIKILKSAMDEIAKDELREVLLEKTGATLIASIGFVITLYKS